MVIHWKHYRLHLSLTPINERRDRIIANQLTTEKPGARTHNNRLYASDITNPYTPLPHLFITPLLALQSPTSMA